MHVVQSACRPHIRGAGDVSMVSKMQSHIETEAVNKGESTATSSNRGRLPEA